MTMRRLFIIVMTLAAGLAASAQQSLTVEDCVRLGLENSVEVRNAVLDTRAARLQKQEVLAEYFPTVNAMGGAFRSLNPFIDIAITDVLGHSDLAYQIQEGVEQWAAPNDINTKFRALNYGYGAVLNLSQPVFAGGRIVAGNRLAALGVRAADTKSCLQRRQSSEDIQKMFYQVLALQEKQVTLDVASRLLDTLYRDVSAAVEAGLALSTDLNAVKLKMSELRAGRSKLDLGLRVAKMNLLDHIGVPYNPYSGIASENPHIDSFVLSGSFSDIMTPSQAYVDEERAVASLDEVSLLQMDVEAKTLERRMTLGAALPSVLFGASYGYTRLLTNPKFNGAAYIMMQIPLTDWGKNSRKLERQRIEIVKSQNQRDFYQGQLILQLRQLYMELSSAYDQMQIARDAEALAGERLSQMHESYNAGVCTVTELLQSEVEARNSSEEGIQATLDYLIALECYNLRVRGGRD